jgi:hypothetical protein
MADIVERLRAASDQDASLDYGEHWNLEDEAADTIEALRCKVEELEAKLTALDAAALQAWPLIAAAEADAKQADEFTHKAIDERDHYMRELQAAQARERERCAQICDNDRFNIGMNFARVFREMK